MSIPVDNYPEISILPYAEARQFIKSGDILLCSGEGIFSKIIQNATKSIWSHVGFILKIDNIDRIMVLESVESIGVRTVPLSFYVNNYDGEGKPYSGKILIARHAYFNPSKIIDLSHKAIDLLGHNYDKGEILKISLRIGASHFSDDKECELPKMDNEYICSEYVYECYKSIGINIDYDCRGFVSPSDFAKTDEIDGILGIYT